MPSTLRFVLVDPFGRAVEIVGRFDGESFVLAYAIALDDAADVDGIVSDTPRMLRAARRAARRAAAHEGRDLPVPIKLRRIRANR